MAKESDCRDFQDILEHVGMVQKFFAAFCQSFAEADGGMRHLKRLVDDEDLRRRVAESVVGECSPTRPLGPSEYRMTVPEDAASLHREFESESRDIYGWSNRDLCPAADEPGERIALVKVFGHEIAGWDAIRKMAQRDYRPATHVEARLFVLAYPHLELPGGLIAPGTTCTTAEWDAGLWEHESVVGVKKEGTFFWRARDKFFAGQSFLFMRC